ncbi:MAG TPA: NAD(P)H-binding protein, partial [Phycisphaerae bacterium]|nr:NAD(P)H-binding protein [Phycisphaerae bacterium]
MRVLLTGANGFLGSAVLARLRAEGHDVVAVTRSQSLGLSASKNIHVDIARATRPEHWMANLHGVDAVINCAGLLQDGPGQSVKNVHVDGVAALFAACEKAGIRRVIHFSAIGVDRAQPSVFSQTKLEGDQALMRRDLDWVILRPSVVVGRSAYGGSALFRGLAALPVLPVLPNTGPLQIVQLEDVVRTVLFFLPPNAPGRVALDLAGPKAYSFTDVVLAFRRWFGWREPYLLSLPRPLARVAFRFGDLLGLLGWRPPIRSTAAAEMVRGATGSFEEWHRITGISPASLDDLLGAELPS